VQYIEGHGAATAVEDLSELTALLDVLGPAGCSLGSVAANIGNAGAAAGVAAVLKTALAMTAGVIPPTTGCVHPHQLLRTGAAPFRLPDQPAPWPDTNVRLAAVNSLGAPGGQGSLWSGPVHLVLRREGELVRLGGRRRHTPAPVWRDAAAVPGGTPRTAASAAAVPPPRPRMSAEMIDPGMSPVRAAPAGAEMTGPAASAGPAMSPGPAMPPGAGAETVIAIARADRADLAVTLDTVALTAERMSGPELHEFALDLASGPAVGAGPARAAIVAADPVQLARRARAAAAELRENPGARTAGTGVYLSPAGAAGRVVLLFPGLASTAIEHSAVLSASMATLDIAERIGVRPQAAVGYSFGEITALAWAGAITFGEAGRLAAHRSEVIRATPGRGAMARVLAGPATASRLLTGTNLALAAQEGPGQHVLAGPVSDIRALPRRAAELDVDVDVLPVGHALHCPAMRPAAAPMRAALENIRFAAPGRRVVSAVTGLDVTGPADAAELLAGQLARPALLAGALALACADADLLLVTARDPALARAAGTDRLPVVQAPLDQRPGAMMPALAAFFAAGAIDSLRPFLPESRRAAPSPAGAAPATGASPPGSADRPARTDPAARAAERSAATSE
jgi:enediyne polyketide synthase